MLQNPQHLNETVSHLLMIGSGIFWTITYLLILRRGFLDKTYGMPMAALCANVSWEFIFSFVFPHPQPQLFIDYLWLLFDVGILWQYIRYGRSSFPEQLPQNLFYPAFLFSLVFAALLIAVISVEFNEYIGIYAAFGQNLMMSILFVHLFLKRKGVQGQSVYIALAKMVGTIFPSVLFYLYFPESYLLLLLYGGIFVFDLVYFLLLYFQLRRERENPWARL
ncbi:hypothetical protein [Rufibacter quisquiliarum]|uniref:Uncharacterized protein n=1 Tax=Rufibacter quisquiliarum TaxID=1549639 RepID=A0A839GGL7_9BACT|nr:hypothetical protein [Rufibacter quisquiliarum]MBA9078794.1 hypothetical protein [Rufibacter quisquiliarum]